MTIAECIKGEPIKPMYTIDEMHMALKKWGKSFDDFIFKGKADSSDVSIIDGELVALYGYIVEDGMCSDYVVCIASGENQGKTVRLHLNSIESDEFDVLTIPSYDSCVLEASVSDGVASYALDTNIFEQDKIVKSYDAETGLFAVVDTNLSEWSNVGVLNDKIKNRILNNLNDNETVAIRVENNLIIHQSLILDLNE